MSVTPQGVAVLIEAELSRLQDQRVVSHIRSLLVPPSSILREWDYGAPEESYPCWAVLDHAKSNTGIAYCEFGFGPRSPWGLVALSGSSNMSIGMDCGWFQSFIEAYFESFAATDLPIWRVFKADEESGSGVAVTEESDWNATWKEVERLRAENPTSRFHCTHNISFPRE